MRPVDDLEVDELVDGGGVDGQDLAASRRRCSTGVDRIGDTRLDLGQRGEVALDRGPKPPSPHEPESTT